MSSTVAIIDYGLGNVISVAGAVEGLGFTAEITDRPDRLAAADRLILPGVGAFGDGMDGLRRRGLVEVLEGLVRCGAKPLLGICLGAQLLAKESEEFGHHRGLGWIDARVVRLSPSDPSLRIPHVGWNDLVKRRDSVLLRDLPSEMLVYFVHSYHLICEDAGVVSAETDYGGLVVAAVEKGHVFGTQFHPERSQRDGLAILRNFLTADVSACSATA